MAAISSAHGDHTALTPPSSSHGEETPWGHSRQQSEQTMHEKNGTTRSEKSQQSPVLHQNGNPSAAPYHNSSFDVTARKMHSVDNLQTSKWDKAVENGALSPPFEPRMSRPSPSTDDLKRPMHQRSLSSLNEDNSKWIHRDKLAKIESQELQAAGIFIPRSRAPSKQRRERSARRGTDASEQGQNRPRNDSTPLETVEASSPIWDLRTPEEIAEEQENAYFVSHGLKGGSRIPVAKISPAPISVDHLERGSTAPRRPADSPETETITPSTTKTRSRSASSTLRETTPATPASGPRGGQRSATDASPKKTGAAGRKTSASSKSSIAIGRPKTRSGPNKDSSSTSGTRPPTRSGDPSSGTKQLEGDPPWMINSYKPDPRLPPDQQIIPTVARRLQQEKWEREGKFGDIYDKEFRPLNDNALLKFSGLDNEPDLTLELPKTENEPTAESKQDQDQSNEWPLKTELTKSPTPRQGSYSTMPKISDMPPKSPLSSPRTPVTNQAKQSQAQQKEKAQAPTRVPSVPDEEEKKGGCGCCVVM